MASANLAAASFVAGRRYAVHVGKEERALIGIAGLNHDIPIKGALFSIGCWKAQMPVRSCPFALDEHIPVTAAGHFFSSGLHMVFATDTLDHRFQNSNIFRAVGSEGGIVFQ